MQIFVFYYYLGWAFYNAASAETILYQMVEWFKNGEVLVARLGYVPGRRDSQFSREEVRKFTLSHLSLLLLIY